jgi:acetamidase/formamidase
MRLDGKTHRLVATPRTVHTGFFDSSIPPVLTIESGDTVNLSTMMLMDDQLRGGMTFEELLVLRQSYVDRKTGGHTLTGPIFVAGAEPGDTLEVRIGTLVPIEWGVNYHLPGHMGIGGLPEDFPHGHIKTFRLDLDRRETVFSPGVTLPLAPFLGVMGVAPRPGERMAAAIPGYFGGNLDNKELREGARLYLPVSVSGALFSAGDAHAAQGDGEVNVTAIETALEEAVLQFVVRKDMRLERPLAETPSHWMTMGFDPDLDAAAKTALRDAIGFLVRIQGLTADEAYAFASVAVDLRITQIVDTNKGVHAMIPKRPFGQA